MASMSTYWFDVLLIVTDTSRRGLQAGLRIHQLAKDLNIGVGKSYIIINQAKSEPSEVVKEMIDGDGLELAGVIPDDEKVYEFDMEGRPTIDIEESNPAFKAAYSIFDKIIP